MKKKRIFIGSFINIASFSKKYSQIKKEFGGTLKGRWIPEKNFHITYKFIGEVDENSLSDIRQVLGGLVNKKIEVDLEFSGLGAFPNIYNPRVFFIKVEDKTGELKILYEYINEKLALLGYKSEKSFIPHVTLKRIKGVDNKKFLEKMKKYSEINLGNQTNIEVNIIESILTPKGAEYKKLD